MFQEHAIEQPQKLGGIADLIEFFTVTYLSRSVPEAISKLTMQHAARTNVQEVHTSTLEAMNGGDDEGFCIGLIKLMACGEF